MTKVCCSYYSFCCQLPGACRKMPWPSESGAKPISDARTATYDHREGKSFNNI
jgi:hypothetical protein